MQTGPHYLLHSICYFFFLFIATGEWILLICMSDSGHNKLFSFPLYSYNWLKCSVQQPTTLYFCGEHLQMLPTFYQFTKKGVILNAYFHHQIYILYHIIWWRFTNMLIYVSEYRVYMRFTVPRAWNVTPTFGVYTWTKHTPAMPINSSCAGFCASMKQQQIEKYFNILIGNVIHPNIYTSALFFFCLVSCECSFTSIMCRFFSVLFGIMDVIPEIPIGLFHVRSFRSASSLRTHKFNVAFKSKLSIYRTIQPCNDIFCVCE